MGTVHVDPLEVFVINDIDLKIPPTNISIQKEDLTYNWRTLRTSTATKIASGHGQMAVHVTIPFTNDLLLSMHRLIVQFRHSPFCYVENRYLRESLVPDWPEDQNMAFTMTGLQVQPMADTSDCWIVQLQMQWFNYLPFTPNYVFREDWETEWIQSETNEGVSHKYTIGWNFDPATGKRNPSSPLRDKDSSGNIKTWNVLTKQYELASRKTIHDMEMQHDGQVFDLLPLPGRMEPSPFVRQPKNSRIYVRYINLLQRDALLDNFGIDVTIGIGGKQKFFHMTQEADQLRTYGLHTDEVPRLTRMGWIDRMLQHNNRVLFCYDTYRSIQLPTAWTGRFDEKIKNTFGQPRNAIGRVVATAESIEDLKKLLNSGTDPMGLILAGENFQRKVTAAHGRSREEGLNNIQDVRAVFENRGVQPSILLGALANAQPESEFSNGASGDPDEVTRIPHAIGFFQIHDKSNSSRPRVFTGDRKNAAYNAEWILDEQYKPYRSMVGSQIAVTEGVYTKQQAYMDEKAYLNTSMDQAYARGDTVAQMAAFWTYYMERPKDIHGQMIHRAKLVETLFGSAIAAMKAKDFDAAIAASKAGLTGPADVVIDDTLDTAKTEQVAEIAKENGINPDDTAQVLTLLEQLTREGWRYYESNLSTTNVWSRSFQHAIWKPYSVKTLDDVPNLLKISPKEFADDAILVGVSGGLRHVTASIPILGHEFPTQQHLGSIEPRYTLEFACLDDSKTHDLQGVGNTGRLIQGMRSTLQSNARLFRPIVDSWTLLTDTFITRLLGTFKETDVIKGSVAGSPVVKRTIIARDSSSTSPGNPGLSLMTLEIEETNPYVQEEIVSMSRGKVAVEEARAQILTALNKSGITPEEETVTESLARRVGDRIASINRPADAVVKDGQIVFNELPPINTHSSTETRISQAKAKINAIILAAELMLAEEDLDVNGYPGGLPISTITEQLYGLPVSPHKWEAFQYYFVQIQNGLFPKLHAIEKNDNFIHHWTLTPEARDVIKTGPVAFFGPSRGFAAAAVHNLTLAPTNLGNGSYFAGRPRKAWNYITNDAEGMAAIERGYDRVVRNELINSYMTAFTAVALLGDLVESTVGRAIEAIIGIESTAGFDLSNSFLEYLDSNNLAHQNVMGFFKILDPGGPGVQYTETRTALFGDTTDVDIRIGAPSVYPTTEQTENNKVEYLKKLLAELADDLSRNLEVMEALGLEDLMMAGQNEQFKGRECYPDLILPAHPYYNSIFNTGPDFYYWSVYEDGGVLSKEIQEQISEQVNLTVSRCYNSMKSFQGPGQSYDPKNEPIGIEQHDSDSAVVGLRLNPEGSDSNETSGAMNTPYAPSEAGIKAEKDWYDKWKYTSKDSLYQDGKDGKVPAQQPPVVNGVSSVRLGTTDGTVLYPSRVSTEKYNELFTTLKSQQEMFGNRAGYTGTLITKETAPNIANRLNETAVARSDEFTHTFDPDSLKILAQESSKDLISQKMSMKRAFPTFKLMFVEEDEFEDRLLNFDDFYSYNGVKEFSVVQSNKMSADTAVIVLQNVAGTLDGTARNTITDLDYYDQSRDAHGHRRIDKILRDQPDSTSQAGDSVAKDTASDQPFGSLILRPGLNVQLRAGYSNDPDSLEVLVTGRVVDVTWNQTGDLAEITVQSFGVELEQIRKGTDASNSRNRTYLTTHQLLGALMLEPELEHFGRWEFGNWFQAGEAKDTRLDFYDYSRESNIMRMRYSKAYLTWLVDHPWGLLLAPIPLLVGAAVLDTGSAGLDAILRPLKDATIGKVKRAYTRANSSLMISPQDDNLYPPSPKDYMQLGYPLWYSSFGEVTKSIKIFAAKQADRVLGLDGLIRNIFDLKTALEKRVDAKACQYSPISSTTWEIFYEMTLRHPGWIFGPRPYGKEHRYTMFFGIPSQRYWSKPAHPMFIQRMNKLHDSISSGKQLDKAKYKELYGDSLESGVTVDNFEAHLLSQRGNDTFDPDYNANLYASDVDIAAPEDPNATVFFTKVVLERTLTARAIKEYLHGLELRFVPFRRYHYFSSNRDLVWNGIQGSESSVINAVDVTYYDDRQISFDSIAIPNGTVVVKASTSLPDHMIRMAPISYPNCRTFEMAMRYGMGELIHQMKEMYRGELIVLGNPRVKPWDIAILADAYNDMVGPVEVLQVVHTFSFETGYLTEIKPGAVVIGNEISSWPMIEAMKLFSLGVHDAEKKMGGVGVSRSGPIGTIAQYFNSFGNKNIDVYKFRKKFPDGVDPEWFSSADFPNADQTINAINSTKGPLAANGKILNTSGSTAMYIASGGTLAPVILAKELVVDTVLDIVGTDIPSMGWLLGGTILMLKCMREDAVIVVPLMKGGTPILAGLSFNDPAMIWSNVAGSLKRWVDDAISGSRDLAGHYSRLGSEMWRVVNSDNFGTDDDTHRGG